MLTKSFENILKHLNILVSKLLYIGILYKIVHDIRIVCVHTYVVCAC